MEPGNRFVCRRRSRTSITRPWVCEQSNRRWNVYSATNQSRNRSSSSGWWASRTRTELWTRSSISCNDTAGPFRMRRSAGRLSRTACVRQVVGVARMLRNRPPTARSSTSVVNPAPAMAGTVSRSGWQPSAARVSGVTAPQDCPARRRWWIGRAPGTAPDHAAAAPAGSRRTPGPGSGTLAAPVDLQNDGVDRRVGQRQACGVTDQRRPLDRECPGAPGRRSQGRRAAGARGLDGLRRPRGLGLLQRDARPRRRRPGLHILNNFNNVGAIEVNAFQSHSDVLIQKSTREGFGLTVSEAIWKGTPVHRRRRRRDPPAGRERRDRLPRRHRRGMRGARRWTS